MLGKKKDGNPDNTGRVARAAEGENLFANVDPKVRTVTMIGLTFAMMVACFDGTIVGTCAPIIVQDLNGSKLYAWMTTAYLLCETIVIPIAGKMSDRFGRKPLFLIGLTIFTLGSICAGMSTSMVMLIICRGFQGLGGGILIPVAIASVGDFYNETERGRIQGILGAVFGIGSAIGPLIGGYIAEYANWRWCFYVSVPFAIIAYSLTIKKFPQLAVDPAKLKKIDYAGISVLILFLADLLLLLQFGGDKFEWVSLESLAMAVVAIALLAVFVFLEFRADDPVLAPRLFRNRTVVAAMIFMALFGLGMMGAMTYASYFNIAIFGLTTLEAGKVSLAMVAGMSITAMSSGALVNKTGYKPWLLAGPIITFLALYWMSMLTYEYVNNGVTVQLLWMTLGDAFLHMMVGLFVLGFGLGCMASVVMIAVQNISKPEEMGMTTSSVNLLRSIGATAGAAIFALLISSRIDTELASRLDSASMEIIRANPDYNGTGILDIFSTTDPTEIGVLITHAQDILSAFASSVDFAFVAGGCIILSLVVFAFIIKGNKTQPRSYSIPRVSAAASAEAPTDSDDAAEESIPEESRASSGEKD